MPKKNINFCAYFPQTTFSLICKNKNSYIYRGECFKGGAKKNENAQQEETTEKVIYYCTNIDAFATWKNYITTIPNIIKKSNNPNCVCNFE